MKSRFNKRIVGQKAIIGFLSLLLLPGYAFSQTPWSFQNATNTHLIPDPTGTEDIRTAGQISGPNPSEWDTATGDVNRDGKIDCIAVRKAPFYDIGQRSGFILLNVDCKLRDVTSLVCPDLMNNPSHARDVQLCDVNGDLFLDAIVANTFGEDPTLYINQRNTPGGRWRGFKIATNWFVTAQGNSSFLADVPTAPATAPGMTSCALACCDVEGDGDNDILLTAYPWTIGGALFSSEDRILINDGSGNFTEEPNRLNHNFVTGFITTGVECADMDADGDVDYVVSHAVGGNVVLFNDGQGFFNTANPNGTTGFFNYMFTLALLNPDLVPDIYGVGDAQDRSGINLGNGTFGPAQLAISRSTLYLGGNAHPFHATTDSVIADGVAVADMDTIASDIQSCSNGQTFTILENQFSAINQPHLVDPDLSTTENYELDGVWDFAFLPVDDDNKNDLIIFHCSGVDLFLQQ